MICVVALSIVPIKISMFSMNHQPIVHFHAKHERAKLKRRENKTSLISSFDLLIIRSSTCLGVVVVKVLLFMFA